MKKIKKIIILLSLNNKKDLKIKDKIELFLINKESSLVLHHIPSLQKA